MRKIPVTSNLVERFFRTVKRNLTLTTLETIMCSKFNMPLLTTDLVRRAFQRPEVPVADAPLDVAE